MEGRRALVPSPLLWTGPFPEHGRDGALCIVRMQYCIVMPGGLFRNPPDCPKYRCRSPIVTVNQSASRGDECLRELRTLDP